MLRKPKKRSIENVKSYIQTSAPQYRSFIYREDILDSIPPNLSDKKKKSISIK